MHRKRSIPIFVFCYHKVGTTLLNSIFRAVCAANDWSYQVILGSCSEIPLDRDVVIFAHSLIDVASLPFPLKGVHFIRDPRDIIVSGYLYHLRTSEPWCINTDFSTAAPIRFPRVPYSQQHRSEVWKKNYPASLHNKSYQQHLIDSTQTEGLLFEMLHYGSWTIESMSEWNYGNVDILELKFEELMSNYSESTRKMFAFLGFVGSELDTATEIASRHDLNRKTANELAQMKHVSSRQTTRWKDYFEPVHKHVFQEKFGSILVDLGYEASNDW